VPTGPAITATISPGAAGGPLPPVESATINGVASRRIDPAVMFQPTTGSRYLWVGTNPEGYDPKAAAARAAGPIPVGSIAPRLNPIQGAPIAATVPGLDPGVNRASFLSESPRQQSYEGSMGASSIYRENAAPAPPRNSSGGNLPGRMKELDRDFSTSQPDANNTEGDMDGVGSRRTGAGSFDPARSDSSRPGEKAIETERADESKKGSSAELPYLANPSLKKSNGDRLDLDAAKKTRAAIGEDELRNPGVVGFDKLQNKRAPAKKVISLDNDGVTDRANEAKNEGNRSRPPTPVVKQPSDDDARRGPDKEPSRLRKVGSPAGAGDQLPEPVKPGASNINRPPVGLVPNEPDEEDDVGELIPYPKIDKQDGMKSPSKKEAVNYVVPRRPDESPLEPINKSRRIRRD
jgi:hypothetical protein